MTTHTIHSAVQFPLFPALIFAIGLGIFLGAFLLAIGARL